MGGATFGTNGSWGLSLPGEGLLEFSGMSLLIPNTSVLVDG